jgi:hypothetical protein
MTPTREAEEAEEKRRRWASKKRSRADDAAFSTAVHWFCSRL